MGPYRGGQAQYIRIPYADFNALKLPPGTENEADFILLADIFPTGWHGVTLSGFKPGETVAVFGGGPVGLMAAYSAQLRGASRTFVVDRVPERLKAAEKIGCIPINFEEGDAVELIIKANDGDMVDRSVDAVGYQAVVKGGQKEEPNIVLENMIKVTRACGGLGIPGLYVPTDPGAPDSDSAKGRISLSFGKLFEKVRCYPPPIFPLPFPRSSCFPPYKRKENKARADTKSAGSFTRHWPMQRKTIQQIPPRSHHLW